MESVKQIQQGKEVALSATASVSEENINIKKTKTTTRVVDKALNSWLRSSKLAVFATYDFVTGHRYCNLELLDRKLQKLIAKGQTLSNTNKAVISHLLGLQDAKEKTSKTLADGGLEQFSSTVKDSPKMDIELALNGSVLCLLCGHRVKEPRFFKKTGTERVGPFGRWCAQFLVLKIGKAPEDFVNFIEKQIRFHAKDMYKESVMTPEKFSIA